MSQSPRHIVYAIRAGERVGEGEFRLNHEYLPELTRGLTRSARLNLLDRAERMVEADRNGNPIRMAR